MKLFLEQLAERQARYRKLRKTPLLKAAQMATLESALDELEWVERHLAVMEPGPQSEPQPKAQQLSLV